MRASRFVKKFFFRFCSDKFLFKGFLARRNLGKSCRGSITAPAFVRSENARARVCRRATAAFEYRFAEGRHERLLQLARELVERRVASRSAQTGGCEHP